MIGLSAIFGLSFTLTNISVAELPPLTVVAARLFLAFLILYPLMRFYKTRMPAIGTIWWPLFASGFFGNALPFGLISWGQVRVEAGLTAIFMAAMPLATLVLAHLFTSDEKLDRYKFTGVIFGLIGVMALMGWNNLSQLGDQTLRQLAILGGALCYAVNAIITKKITHLPKWSAMTALMFASSIMMVPVSLAFDQPWTFQPSADALLALLALAIGPTAMATVLILIIIERQGASFLSQINFMVPVFGMFFGVVFLSEVLPANAYIALVIILFGIALSRYGSSRRKPVPT